MMCINGGYKMDEIEIKREREWKGLINILDFALILVGIKWVGLLKR